MVTKSKIMYRIYGHVIDHNSHQGMPGVRVEAWDHDVVYDDMLASTTTNHCGDFRLDFKKSDFENMYMDKHPHLFFKIIRDNQVVESTEHSTLWKIVKPGITEFTIDVDED